MLEVLSSIVLILLAMVSYSSGVTVAARRREYIPSILDLLVVAMLWVILFLPRPELIRIVELLITIGLGLIFGYIIGMVRLSGQDTSKIIPKSELPEHAIEKTEIAAAPNPLRRYWDRWVDFSGRMGNVQGRLLMGFFYFLIVTPFGLISRLFTDPLAIKKTPTQSNWNLKEATDLTIEASKEQG